MYNYNFCSNCGASFNKISETLYECPKCDFRIFISPKPSVGAFIFNENNQVLFLKRSHNPGKGLLGIPGGFISPNETLPEALKRESLEEIGVEVQDLEYFRSYYGNYEYKGIVYKTITTIFICKMNSNSNIKISDDESIDFKFYDLNDIKVEDIGTEDVKKAVTELIQSRLR